MVNDLRREGVAPGQVSVLFTRRPNEAQAKVLARLGIEPLDDAMVPLLGSSAVEHITWSTASGFKGLENDVVILAGVDDLQKDWFRGVVYVGMSRARTRLYVVLSEGCEEERQRRVRAQGEQRSSDVEMLL